MGDEGVWAVGDRSSVVPEAVTVGGGADGEVPRNCRYNVILCVWKPFVFCTSFACVYFVTIYYAGGVLWCGIKGCHRKSGAYTSLEGRDKSLIMAVTAAVCNSLQQGR